MNKPVLALIPDKNNYLGSWNPSWDKIAESICPLCGHPIGYDELAEPVEGDWHHQSCPEVKVPCQVYSRVVGYMTPTNAWNQGKQQEFSERKTFKVPGENHETS